MRQLKPGWTPVDEREISLALGPMGRKLASLGYELLRVPEMDTASRVVFAIQRMNPEADEADEEEEL